MPIARLRSFSWAYALAIIRHHGKPKMIIDKSSANTAALATLNADKPSEETIILRQTKYLKQPDQH